MPPQVAAAAAAHRTRPVAEGGGSAQGAAPSVQQEPLQVPAVEQQEAGAKQAEKQREPAAESQAAPPDVAADLHAAKVAGETPSLPGDAPGLAQPAKPASWAALAATGAQKSAPPKAGQQQPARRGGEGGSPASKVGILIQLLLSLAVWYLLRQLTPAPP